MELTGESIDKREENSREVGRRARKIYKRLKALKIK